MFTRNNTRKIKVGNIFMGGGAEVTVQSMLNVPAENIEDNVKQAKLLENAGCQIIRTAVPNADAVKLVTALKENVSVPIVADIHFDYRIALKCVEVGVDKIRINPGNVGDDDKVKQIVNACKLKNIPIRIGVNSGSVEKNILAKYGAPTPEALVESGMYHVKLLEKYDFNDIALSIKSSDVNTMYKAYELASEVCPYPLHLGVTEAGTKHSGLVRSAVGIGGLLLRGIGDTIRVSLTDNPIEEVKAGLDILSAAGLRNKGVKFVSCPTCGRTKINLIKLAEDAEEALQNCKKDITVAIMGCVVNGPGEAREADIGIAGGDNCGLIFKKGEIIKKTSEDKLLEALLEEIDKM